MSIELNLKIKYLERLLVATPFHRKAVNALVEILSDYTPVERGFGAYTECQQTISSSYQGDSWLNNLVKPKIAAKHFQEWDRVLAAKNLNPPILKPQLFDGKRIEINGERSFCGNWIPFFNEKQVIPKYCNSCFKVQILPQNFLAMVQIYFALRGLKLPRNNRRKCMIELRRQFPFPYKGYIYCESEDEANFCLGEFQKTIQKFGIEGVRCGLSHGCSEYGLEYPNFKYSNSGSHRNFERMPSWDQIEKEYFEENPLPKPALQVVGDQSITINEVIGIKTWIVYAQIIGDDSCKEFQTRENSGLVPGFLARIRNQAHMRKAEMEELRQSMS